MSDQQADHRLSAEELRAANYAATLTLRGGESIFDGKQLGAYLLLVRAVFESAVDGAERADTPDAKTAYLTAAFMTAYNISSNTWPGWNEGAIDPADQRVGLAFAREHLRIVDTMDLPAPKRAVGLWIGGAHELAAKNYDASRAMFARAVELSEQSGSEEQVLMNRGWQLLADILEGDVGAQAGLRDIQQKLSAMGDDGQFYAAQYDGALEALGK